MCMGPQVNIHINTNTQKNNKNITKQVADGKNNTPDNVAKKTRKTKNTNFAKKNAKKN